MGAGVVVRLPCIAFVVTSSLAEATAMYKGLAADSALLDVLFVQVVADTVDAVDADIASQFKLKKLPALAVVDGQSVQPFSGDITHDAMRKFVLRAAAAKAKRK